MHQQPNPDRYEDEDLEELGTSVYQGDGLTVRGLDAEELQRFLDAHAGQPAERLGSGWAALGPPGHPHGVPRTPPEVVAPGLLPAVPAGPVASSLGSPGRSALTRYRRRRALELAGWTRSLAWRVPLVAAAGLTGSALAARVGLPWAGLVGLVVAALIGWRLRFRPSDQARTWQRGATGERHTARRLRRLARDGFVVFHDLALPGSDANVDHLVIGPSGVFVVDSKQWIGSIHQGADGLAWHNHYPLDRTLDTVRWEAQAVGHLLGTRVGALLCVHGAHIQGGGVDIGGVAIVPANRLRDALGHDRVLSDADRRPARHHRLDQAAPSGLSVREPDSTGGSRTQTLRLKPRPCRRPDQAPGGRGSLDASPVIKEKRSSRKDLVALGTTEGPSP